MDIDFKNFHKNICIMHALIHMYTIYKFEILINTKTILRVFI